jgi:hypothetical protein
MVEAGGNYNEPLLGRNYLKNKSRPSRALRKTVSEKVLVPVEGVMGQPDASVL